MWQERYFCKGAAKKSNELAKSESNLLSNFIVLYTVKYGNS